MAFELALELDAYIVSLDSLSVYKEIDIVSAKPSLEQLLQIKHYGINVIYPNENFNVSLFGNIYLEAYQMALKNSKNLILVGGTSFYLKSLIDGLSDEIKIDKHVQDKVKELLQDIDKSYRLLQDIDFEYAQKITKHDKYRIGKALAHYYQTQNPISYFFKNNPKKPIIKGSLELFLIDINKDELSQKIRQRTALMLKDGLIDEVLYLTDKYPNYPKCFNSIGIKETIKYFENKISYQQLSEEIIQNTIKLAKRQKTFNKTQFNNITHISPTDKQTIYKKIK